jgi:hypothetical protein
MKKKTLRMSRGPGRVQRKILELIEREPNGAWSFENLCHLVYGRHPTKSRRVATGRAIRLLKPGTWTVEFDRGKGWLCDPCNLQSQRIVHNGDSAHYKPGGWYYEKVERAKRSRDGLSLEPLNARSPPVYKSRTK